MPANRKKCIAVVCMLITAATLCACASAKAATPEKAEAKPRLGMNLHGPADWNSELPFVDVFRLSRTWISQKKGASWGQGPKLMKTDPADYVRNIRVIMPGFEDTYQENPFHPVFLKRWQGIACLRFMDWMKTNGSEIRTWSDRLVRVLAWQSGNTWWMERIILPHRDAYKHADALAIAPYIGMNVPRQGEGLTAGEVAAWSVDRALDHLEQECLPKSIRAIRATKEVADKFGLTLVAYEGGQHMVGVAGGENNETMTKLFHAANAHPRMARIYEKYFDAWTDAGGDLFCYFSSVGSWSKWGSWGIIEYYDDDPRQSPKFMATMRWARKCGQKVRLPE